MSAIKKAVLKACDIDDQGKDESRQDFLKRVVRAINKLEDKDYDKLMDDKAVGGWFNSAADVADANKKNDKSDPLPDFPDAEKQQEEGSSRRRRGGDDEAPKAKGGNEKVDPSNVKEGMVVTITTKRNKVYKDVKVIEVTKKFIAFKDGEEEVEIDFDRIEMTEIFNDGQAQGGRRKSEDDEPQGPKEPAKGDTVTIVTKRGKTVKGKVLEITDDEIVVTTDDGDEEFNRERIESIKVEGGSEKKGSKAAPKDGEEPARTRASNGGVSVGQRIRELIVDNIDAKEEEIGKLLKKEKLEYRDNTLALTFKETHKMLDLLRDRKLLKK